MQNGNFLFTQKSRILALSLPVSYFSENKSFLVFFRSKKVKVGPQAPDSHCMFKGTEHEVRL